MTSPNTSLTALRTQAATTACSPSAAPETPSPRASKATPLFALLGRKPHFRHVPVALLDGIIATLAAAARLAPSLADKAELARIGRYYATESMLLLDPDTGRYDAAATPATGTDTLFDYYKAVLTGISHARTPGPRRILTPTTAAP